MSINIENMFIRSNKQTDIAALLKRYWQGPPLGKPVDWGLPSSFTSTEEDEAKRKVAFSEPQNGWIIAIESKNSVDFALAQFLSEKLQTTILIIQIYEITSTVGYAVAECGRILESAFFPEHEAPLEVVHEVMRKYHISFEITAFREVFRNPDSGWIVSQQRLKSSHK
jgi:hypothetical protein